MIRRGAAVATCILCVFAQGQPDKSLLLPQPRHVSGIVVDQDGNLVTGASFDGSEFASARTPVTDENGNFAFDTKAPFLVVRKSGFQGERISTQSASELHLTLRKIDPTRIFPACSEGASGKRLGLLRGELEFARTPDIKASDVGGDVDYGGRNYYRKGAKRFGVISHGEGPAWSLGAPLKTQVWRSVQFEEIDYISGIVDVRGEYPNGKRWRSLGKFGESASYVNVDAETAKAFDRFLDSACLKPTPR